MTGSTTTALVTGGNRGIGLAVVRALAQLDGYRVLMGCRDPAAEELADLPGHVLPVELELGDDDRLQRGLDAILASHARIDVLVNNAGVLESGGLLGIEPATLDAHMQVNFRAAYMLARRLVPAMIDNGYGRVVNVSSGWGSFARGLGGPAAYSISKAALNALTVILAREAPGDTVKVNAADPGWVRTRMGGDNAPEMPEDAADTIVWLATLPHDGPTGGFFHRRKPTEW